MIIVLNSALAPSLIAASFIYVGVPSIAWADDPKLDNTALIAENALPALIDGKRTFLPSYFSDISPQTAGDMVKRLPGFSIEDGDQVRGFGGAAGNVLIDASRPTSKTENLGSILGRISASNVEKIELLEGAAAGALAPGKSLVVNIVRKADSKASGKWEVRATGMSSGRIRPRIDTAYTSKIGGFSVTTGLKFDVDLVDNLIGNEAIVTPDGTLLERGANDDRRRSKQTQASLALSGHLGGTKINANASYRQQDYRRNWVYGALRPAALSPFRIDQGYEDHKTQNWELGGDLERSLAGWTGKLALLAKADDYDDLSWAGFNLVGDPRRFDRFSAVSNNTERVARATFSRKFDDHQIETGGEYAYNSLDFTGQYSLGDSTVFVVQPSDIASTRVSEDRIEAFLSDSWTISPSLTLESTLTGEWSTINQSGDAAKSRSFFYPKPRIKAAWKPQEGWTYRLEVERSVGQLDFGAFADSASVGDNNQNSGNPELRPEKIWSSLVGVEKRWGKRGVLNASLVQESFTDQLTLVPTGNGGVALGNVRDAKRWGYDLAWTLPLSVLLEGLEIDGNYSWRTSELVDPITDQPRPFSGWNGNTFNSNIIYEIPKKKLRLGAWIWRGDNESDYRPDQKYNWQTSQSWAVWIETKAYKNLTIEFGVENPLGSTYRRVRTDYAPDRRSGIVSQTQYRERSLDGTWYLVIKGTLS